jgi:hypothetical protein
MIFASGQVETRRLPGYLGRDVTLPLPDLDEALQRLVIEFD